jgi:Putative prokaryotic signal transducing protein
VIRQQVARVAQEVSLKKTDQLVLAYRTPSSAEARALALQLTDAGIEARVVGDFLGGGYAGVVSDVEVWIPAADHAAASALVANWESQRAPFVERVSATGFRFSMFSVVAVVTIAAALVAAFYIRPEKSNAYVDTIYLLTTLAVLVLIVRRWLDVTSRKTGDDDRTP